MSLDEHFNEIITKIKSGQRVLNFKLTDGILFRESQGTDKICLPENLLEHVFWNEHHSIHGQHRSPSQICNTLMKTYYAVNMFKKFTGFANRCHFCMVNKPNNSKAQVIQVDMKVTAPRQVWGFDICGGLSVTKLGHSLIYIYVDTFSNYVQLIPASSKSADSIINSIKNNILTPFGPPLAIRSDGEHGLVTSQAAKEFTASHGVQVLPTAAYSPWTNGLSETVVKMTKKLVRTVCDASGNDQWDEQLHLLSWAINSSVGRYKFSPEEMMYGRVSRRPIDPLWVDWTAKDEEEHMAHVKQNLDKIHAVVADLRQKHRQQEADRKNVTRQAKLFKEGDLVYVLSGLFTAPSGLLVKKLGPFLVEEISAHGQTALQQ